MIARLCWASLMATALVLSPTSRAQGEDQRPLSEETTTESGSQSESEPEPVAVVESAGEPPADPDAARVDEEIESRAADDTDRADESEPPQAEPAAEIFVPSEDISEDFAVPFPVDI
ncbi:MAG: hypothetical protein OXH15_10825 [Gammaproteobacteria bacterium]|nr:hypothetical protein [Gammaproteobacteria bacterium]